MDTCFFMVDLPPNDPNKLGVDVAGAATNPVAAPNEEGLGFTPNTEFVSGNGSTGCISEKMREQVAVERLTARVRLFVLVGHRCSAGVSGRRVGAGHRTVEEP